jgi:hypothetical protein
MIHAAFSASQPGGLSADYRPGVCNIGPAEIARRRRAGHVGLIVTIALLAGLVLIQAPPLARLVLIIPAAVSASGYLQAYLKFCAGFGSRGIFNFGEVGTTQRVGDAASRALDRARANRIMAASLAVGIGVAVIAVLLPV